MVFEPGKLREALPVVVDSAEPDGGECIMHVSPDGLPSARITGTVHDSRGVPPRGATLNVMRADAPEKAVAFDIDSGTGLIEAGPLPPVRCRFCLILRQEEVIELGEYELAPDATLDLGEIELD
jgi:hypothetical protein